MMREVDMRGLLPCEMSRYRVSWIPVSNEMVATPSWFRARIIGLFIKTTLSRARISSICEVL